MSKLFQVFNPLVKLREWNFEVFAERRKCADTQVRSCRFNSSNMNIGVIVNILLSEFLRFSKVFDDQGYLLQQLGVP
jgi:hypothetical protein